MKKTVQDLINSPCENREYHLRMLLHYLENNLPSAFTGGGDTRMYLSLDIGERHMMIEIMKEMLAREKTEDRSA